jgi:hypothetical protein
MVTKNYNYRIALDGGQLTQDQLLKIAAAAQKMADDVTGAGRKAADALKPAGEAVDGLAARISQGLKSSGIVTAIEEIAGTVSGRLVGAFETAQASSGALGAALTNLGPIGLAAGAGIGFLVEKIAGLRQYAEIEQAQLRIAAVLKATGASAGLTAGQLRELTNEIAAGSFATKAEVREAEAILLTYTNVVGNNYVKALKLADDASAVFGGGIAQWSRTLGQALENPVDGMQRLRRLHIELSDAQKQLITTTQTTEGVAAAQAVEMDILAGKIGGAAEGEHAGLAGAFDSASKAQAQFLKDLNDSPVLFAAAKSAAELYAAALKSLGGGFKPTLELQLQSAEGALAQAEGNQGSYLRQVAAALAKQDIGRGGTQADDVEGLRQRVADIKQQIESAQIQEQADKDTAALNALRAELNKQGDSLIAGSRSLADQEKLLLAHRSAVEQSANAVRIADAGQKAYNEALKAIPNDASADSRALLTEKAQGLRAVAEGTEKVKIAQEGAKKAAGEAAQELTKEDAALRQAAEALTSFVNKQADKALDPGTKIVKDYNLALTELAVRIGAAREALDSYQGSGKEQQKLTEDLAAAESAYDTAIGLAPAVLHEAEEAHNKAHDAAYKELTNLVAEVDATKGGAEALKQYNEIKKEAEVRAQVYASVLGFEKTQTDDLAEAQRRATDAADKAVQKTRELFGAQQNAALIGKAEQAWDNAFKNAANQIDNTIVRSLRDAFDGKKATDWGQTMKTILADLAAQIVNIALIKPAIGQALLAAGMTESAASFGASPAAIAGATGSNAGGAGFTGTLSNASSLFSTGSSAFNLFKGGAGLGTSVSGAFTVPLAADFVGPPTAAQAAASSFSFFAPQAAGASSGFLGGSGALGLGLSSAGMATGIGALIMIGRIIQDNNKDNALGKGLLGLMGPGIDQVMDNPKLAIPTALGVPFLNAFGLFDKKPSVGPNFNSIMGVDSAGAAARLASGADNGGSVDDAVTMGNAAAKGINAFVQLIGATAFANTGGGQVGQFKQKFFSSPLGEVSSEFGSADEAVQDFVVRSLKRADYTGIGEDVVTAIRHSIATNIDDLVKDAAFATGFRDTIKAFMTGQTDPTKLIEVQASVAGQALLKTITDFKAKTAELGLDTAAAADATKSLLDIMIGVKDAAPPMSAAAQQLAVVKANFEALKPALMEVGYTAAQATDLIAGGIARTRRQLQGDYVTGLARDTYSAYGLGVVNDIAAIKGDFSTDLGTASALGLGPEFASNKFNARILAAVRSAGSGPDAGFALNAILANASGAGADDFFIRAAVGAMMGQNKAADDLTKAAEQQQAAAQKQQEAAQALAGVTSFLRTLDVSELSPLSPANQLAAARGLVEGDKASGNNANLPGDEQTYLKLAQTFYGIASPEYAAIYAREKGDLTAIVDPVATALAGTTAAVNGTTSAVIASGAAVVAAIGAAANRNSPVPGVPASVFNGFNPGQIAAFAASYNRNAPSIIPGLTNGDLEGFSPEQIATFAASLGIPARAGGGDLDPGIALVGERGPELVATGGARVFNAGQTRQILSGSGGDSRVPEKLDELITLAKAALFENATLRRINSEQLAELARLRAAAGSPPITVPRQAFAA